MYHIYISANRRRRHSLEDRYDASIALPKRPRVFFSEEQKERLRQAYNRDPYPNQNTIEALANTLGVGVKTVINWFHNHRMRAKQQQHATSPTTPFSEYSQQSLVKEESNDGDNSNNSDLPSLSDNREALNNALSFHARFINTDSNQWMFPKFEPVNMTDKEFSVSSENNGNENSENDEGNDENTELADASSPSYSAKDNSLNAKDSENDRDDDDEEELEKDENSNTDPLVEKGDKDFEITKGQVPNTAHSGGANKRKRSHPQYVSAGRHLDRTIDRIGSMQKGLGSKVDMNETEKENTNENIDFGSKTENTIKDSEMEESESGNELKENGKDLWKEKDSDIGSNIENLQKRISQHSGEDWEF